MKIKEIKIVNQDQSTEVASIGADAINVDYNNTTVKAELDKLNTNNNSLINTQTSQGTKLANLQSQVNGLASGSPLAASSISEMVKTDKVYVNTTDGYWYYYNGSNWVTGGVYQAAVDSTKIPELEAKTNVIVNKFYHDIKEEMIIIPNKELNNSYNLVDSTNYNAIAIPLQKIIDYKVGAFKLLNNQIMPNTEDSIYLLTDASFNKLTTKHLKPDIAFAFDNAKEDINNFNAYYVVIPYPNNELPNLQVYYLSDNKKLKEEYSINPELINKNLYEFVTDFGTFSPNGKLNAYQPQAGNRAINAIRTSENLILNIAPQYYSIYDLNGNYISGGRSSLTTTDYVTEDCIVVIMFKSNVDLSNLIIKTVGNTDTIGKIKSEFLNDISTELNSVKTKFINTTWSALGDSLTANGSGGFYLNYVKSILGLTDYKNCGIGGTRVSGQGDTCFWQDIRVNSLDLKSQVITIMGGTNDANYTNVSDSDFSLQNYDTDNFVGAYNVLISKIFYKFLKLTNGYYSNINYSNITQVTEINPNFRIILITPPQRFDNINSYNNVMKFASYVEKIAKMWGIICLNSSDVMQMNFMTYPTNRQDKVHFPEEFHKKLAEGLCGLARKINPIN